MSLPLHSLVDITQLQHVWLSRVEIPHHKSPFFRDKAIQSKMISTLLITFNSQKSFSMHTPAF